MNRFSRASIAVAALFVLIIVPPVARAQTLEARSGTGVASVGTVVTERPERLDMLVGRSAIVRMDRPITRVSVSTPEIADAMVTSPYELLVHGKAPGTISLFVWADGGRIKTYDVAVKRDLTSLDEQVHKLFPGEPIAVASNGKDVVLSGVVSGKFIADRAAALALGYVDKPENVVNLLRQQEGVATDQVMLQVRFAEVSRSAMQEIGASFFTGPNGRNDWLGRTTTQQFPAPAFDQDKGLVFSDFLNLFLFNSKEQIGTLIKALSTKGLFQSLAEPNLITQDGKEASFLAGGEYPYPVVQGTGAGASVTIVFKEFGVRLHFTPTILGDLIHLKVAPEVSTLDFTNAIVSSGFRIPSLTTRKTDTEVELRDGQTFAIAGLLDNRVNETMSKMPGIGDIPVLGYLFKSRAYQKNATELVVMITPRVVRRDSPGVTPNLPAPVTPYLNGSDKRLPVPPPAFSGAQSRVVTDQTPDRAEPVSTTAAAAPEAAKAPAPTAAVQAPVQTSQPEAVRKPSGEDRKRALAQQRAAEEARKKQQEEDRAAAVAAAKATADKVKADREEAERQKIEDAKRAAAEEKEAAHAKEVADVMAKEAARKSAEQAKLEAEHQDEERKLAERKKEAEEKLAKEQARRDEALLKALTAR